MRVFNNFLLAAHEGHVRLAVDYAYIESKSHGVSGRLLLV